MFLFFKSLTIAFVIPSSAPPPTWRRSTRYAKVLGMKNLLGALGIVFAACGAPSTACDPPPYADLSSWFTTGATFEYDCGIAVKASLRTEPDAAGLVRGDWYAEEPDADAAVSASIGWAGAGQLSLELFSDQPLGASSPSSNGAIGVLARVPAGHCSVSFLAFASAPDFRWSVSRVQLRSVGVGR